MPILIVMQGDAQVHVQVTPWLSHVFRLYDGARHLEFEWEAGPLPTDDGGMQVMMLLLLLHHERDCYDCHYHNQNHNHNHNRSK